MANFCESCGAKVGAGEKFCPECGEPLSVREEKPAPKPVAHSAEGYQAMDAAPKGQGGNKNSLLYAVGAVVIAAAIGGGFYFMNQHPSVGGNSSIKAGKLNPSGNEKATAGQNHAQGNSVATQQNPGAAVGNNNSGSAGQNVPPVSGSSIAGASHSSADQEGSYVHSALLAIDGDTKTCWAEGVKGYGIGESITVNFNSTYRVNGMNIWTGHQKTEDLFYKNARPLTVRITGSDGSNDIYNLNDMLGVQRINFRKPMDVNYIKITVEKIAPGNKYEDTCIAEVSFF